MGWFSKTPKPNPRIAFDGIEAEFLRGSEHWTFNYRKIDFSSFELSLTLPSKSRLDAMVDSLTSLGPEMKSRLENGLREWGGSVPKVNDGESCMIDISNLSTEGVFTVTWSDGASWGDMAVDFTVKDDAIIDEAWGD
jgi:hypothetical protein